MTLGSTPATLAIICSQLVVRRARALQAEGATVMTVSTRSLHDFSSKHCATPNYHRTSRSLITRLLPPVA